MNASNECNDETPTDNQMGDNITREIPSLRARVTTA
jgi:hypothetical protein